MPFIQKDEIRYYTFELLSETKLIHAVFTRRGGVSPAPWDSLNLGGTVEISLHMSRRIVNAHFTPSVETYQPFMMSGKFTD